MNLLILIFLLLDITHINAQFIGNLHEEDNKAETSENTGYSKDVLTTHDTPVPTTTISLKLKVNEATTESFLRHDSSSSKYGTDTGSVTDQLLNSTNTNESLHYRNIDGSRNNEEYNIHNGVSSYESSSITTNSYLINNSSKMEGKVHIMNTEAITTHTIIGANISKENAAELDTVANGDENRKIYGQEDNIHANRNNSVENNTNALGDEVVIDNERTLEVSTHGKAQNQSLDSYNDINTSITQANNASFFEPINYSASENSSIVDYNSTSTDDITDVHETENLEYTENNQSDGKPSSNMSLKGDVQNLNDDSGTILTHENTTKSVSKEFGIGSKDAGNMLNTTPVYTFSNNTRYQNGTIHNSTRTTSTFANKISNSKGDNLSSTDLTLNDYTNATTEVSGDGINNTSKGHLVNNSDTVEETEKPIINNTDDSSVADNNLPVLITENTLINYNSSSNHESSSKDIQSITESNVVITLWENINDKEFSSTVDKGSIAFSTTSSTDENNLKYDSSISRERESTREEIESSEINGNNVLSIATTTKLVPDSNSTNSELEGTTAYSPNQNTNKKYEEVYKNFTETTTVELRFDNVTARIDLKDNAIEIDIEVQTHSNYLNNLFEEIKMTTPNSKKSTLVVKADNSPDPKLANPDVGNEVLVKVTENNDTNSIDNKTITDDSTLVNVNHFSTNNLIVTEISLNNEKVRNHTANTENLRKYGSIPTNDTDISSSTFTLQRPNESTINYSSSSENSSKLTGSDVNMEETSIINQTAIPNSLSPNVSTDSISEVSKNEKQFANNMMIANTQRHWNSSTERGTVTMSTDFTSKDFISDIPPRLIGYNSKEEILVATTKRTKYTDNMESDVSTIQNVDLQTSSTKDKNSQKIAFNPITQINNSTEEVFVNLANKSSMYDMGAANTPTATNSSEQSSIATKEFMLKNNINGTQSTQSNFSLNVNGTERTDTYLENTNQTSGTSLLLGHGDMESEHEVNKHVQEAIKEFSETSNKTSIRANQNKEDMVTSNEDTNFNKHESTTIKIDKNKVSISNASNLNIETEFLHKTENITNPILKESNAYTETNEFAESLNTVQTEYSSIYEAKFNSNNSLEDVQKLNNSLSIDSEGFTLKTLFDNVTNINKIGDIGIGEDSDSSETPPHGLNQITKDGLVIPNNITYMTVTYYTISAVNKNNEQQSFSSSGNDLSTVTDTIVNINVNTDHNIIHYGNDSKDDEVSTATNRSNDEVESSTVPNVSSSKANNSKILADEDAADITSNSSIAVPEKSSQIPENSMTINSNFNINQTTIGALTEVTTQPIKDINTTEALFSKVTIPVVTDSQSMSTSNFDNNTSKLNSTNATPEDSVTINSNFNINQTAIGALTEDTTQPIKDINTTQALFSKVTIPVVTDSQSMSTSNFDNNTSKLNSSNAVPENSMTINSNFNINQTAIGALTEVTTQPIKDINTTEALFSKVTIPVVTGSQSMSTSNFDNNTSKLNSSKAVPENSMTINSNFNINQTAIGALTEVTTQPIKDINTTEALFSKVTIPVVTDSQSMSTSNFDNNTSKLNSSNAVPENSMTINSNFNINQTTIVALTEVTTQRIKYIHTTEALFSKVTIPVVTDSQSMSTSNFDNNTSKLNSSNAVPENSMTINSNFNINQTTIGALIEVTTQPIKDINTTEALFSKVTIPVVTDSQSMSTSNFVNNTGKLNFSNAVPENSMPINPNFNISKTTIGALTEVTTQPIKDINTTQALFSKVTIPVVTDSQSMSTSNFDNNTGKLNSTNAVPENSMTINLNFNINQTTIGALTEVITQPIKDINTTEALFSKVTIPVVTDSQSMSTSNFDNNTGELNSSNAVPENSMPINPNFNISQTTIGALTEITTQPIKDINTTEALFSKVTIPVVTDSQSMSTSNFDNSTSKLNSSNAVPENSMTINSNFNINQTTIEGLTEVTTQANKDTTEILFSKDTIVIATDHDNFSTDLSPTAPFPTVAEATPPTSNFEIINPPNIHLKPDKENNSVISSSVTSEVESNSPGTSDAEFVCEATGKFPDPENCNIYHVCMKIYVKYAHVLIKCPTGMLYDSKTTKCTRKPVHCPTDVTLSCTTSGIFPHPNYRNRYYKCFWRPLRRVFVLWQFRCPPHMKYDPQRRFCVKKALLPTCGGSSCEEDIEEDVTEAPFFCTEMGRFPVEYSCRNFYDCKEKKGVLQQKLRTCSVGKLFDRELGRCRSSILVFCPYDLDYEDISESKEDW